MINPYIAEFVGTTILLLLGMGVVANVNLKKTIGSGQTPWVLITSAWGFAVFVAVFITGQFSGAHLNPAVTLGLAVAGKFSWDMALGYIFAQLLGAMAGSWLAYILYIDHYRATDDVDAVRSTFCTGPAVRNLKNNLFSEATGTFMLVFGILFIAGPTMSIQGAEATNFGIGSLDALPVGILVWVIGMALGGTTGYAINPARDFGPRLVHHLIPMRQKNSDWSYAWIPVLGPFIGGAVAGLLYLLLM
jgi:glycerol uptake facilitator protein